MLKHASIIITLLTASLYTLGLVFHIGFLSELGIEETLFQLSFHRTLFQGFTSTMLMGWSAAFWLLLAAEAILAVVIIGSFVGQLKFSGIQKFFEKIKTPEVLNNKYVDLAQKLFVATCVLMIVFFFLFLIIFSADQAGRKSAIQFKENIKKGLMHKHLITLKNAKKPLSGYPVVCNSDQCAYIIANKAIVFNLSDIKQLESSLTINSGVKEKSVTP